MERTYNVPLRKDFSKAPRHKKAHRAMTSLRSFLMQHMKCSNEQLRIGKKLNDEVWAKGIKNPPHHVKVTAIKQDDGIVKVELFGFKYPEPIKPVSKEEKETKKETKKAGDKVVDAETVEEKPKKAKTEKKDTKTEEKVQEVKVTKSEEEKSKAKSTETKAAEEKTKKTVKKTTTKKPAEEKTKKSAAKKTEESA